MKPDPLTEPLVGTLTEARPFVVSSVSLVVQLGGVWRRLWRKQKAKLQAKHLCASARGLRMELTLTCSFTSQRREGGGLGSGLHLTVGAAPRCCWDGRRSRFRSVVDSPTWRLESVPCVSSGQDWCLWTDFLPAPFCSVFFTETFVQPPPSSSSLSTGGSSLRLEEAEGTGRKSTRRTQSHRKTADLVHTSSGSSVVLSCGSWFWN